MHISIKSGMKRFVMCKLIVSINMRYRIWILVVCTLFCCIILILQLGYIMGIGNRGQHLNPWFYQELEGRMSFEISRTWDSKPIEHDPVRIKLYPQDDHIIMEINAPFFNDPPSPEGKAGEPFNKLWDYEVVEAFFLGRDEKYLEVEFSPHGQHLLLLLSGRKNAIKMCLPVEYTATIKDEKWHGTAKIPKTYFPPNVNMFNAYAIHGSDKNRTYEALYPVSENHFEYPDFHRLEFFRYIDFSKFLPDSHPLSEIWIDAVQKSRKEEKLVCLKD